ncbi:MAG: endonuclease/exonuclease/phosphatase family protein [Nocardioidaceae bacterium]
MSSFNVLGASHTPPGGKRASGSTRIVWVDRLLARHHVQVAGFQEMQASQATKFLAINRGTWNLYPGVQGKKLDSDNSVGWSKAKFRFVSGTLIRIPYFDGHTRNMPVVLLRDKTSGMLTYFANFHNPADTQHYRNQQKWRRAATRVEIRLENRLALTGIPRILTGDMNERGAYFCRVTAGAPLKAARAASYRSGGRCYPHRPRAVDWVLGSVRTTFTNYFEDRSHLVDITTDHPVITSDVSVDPADLPNGWGSRPAPLVFRSGY